MKRELTDDRAALEADLSACRSVQRELIAEVDRLEAEAGRLRAELASCREALRLTPDEAAPPAPAAAFPPLPQGGGDARFQLGFEHGYAASDRSYPDDPDYGRGHRTGALFRARVLELAPLIHRDARGRLWVAFHHVGWMERAGGSARR